MNGLPILRPLFGGIGDFLLGIALRYGTQLLKCLTQELFGDALCLGYYRQLSS